MNEEGLINSELRTERKYGIAEHWSNGRMN
jgi:hypothetical protein